MADRVALPAHPASFPAKSIVVGGMLLIVFGLAARFLVHSVYSRAPDTTSLRRSGMSRGFGHVGDLGAGSGWHDQVLGQEFFDRTSRGLPADVVGGGPGRASHTVGAAATDSRADFRWWNYFNGADGCLPAGAHGVRRGDCVYRHVPRSTAAVCGGYSLYAWHLQRVFDRRSR
jgi:hypothetical protein